MSTTYIFHDQAGIIPGVPGAFAHCIVQVDEQGNAEVLPLVPVETPDLPIEETQPRIETQQAPVEEVQAPTIEQPIEQTQVESGG